MDRQPGGFERGSDLGLAIDEDPGRHAASRRAAARHAGRRPAARGRRRSGWRGRRRTAARRSGGCRPVPGCAARAGSGGRSPRVDSMAIGSVSTPRASDAPSFTAAIARMPEPQPTSRTRAPSTRPSSAIDFERGQAQAGRRVEPGPEGHARVEGEDDVVGLAPMPPPGRTDDEAPTDAHHREVRLPGLGPVLLVHDPGPQLADRSAARTPGGGRALRRSSPRRPRPRTRRARARTRGRWPAGPDRPALQALRRPGRTRAPRSCHRSRPGRGSR